MHGGRLCQRLQTTEQKLFSANLDLTRCDQTPNSGGANTISKGSEGNRGRASESDEILERKNYVTEREAAWSRCSSSVINWYQNHPLVASRYTRLAAWYNSFILLSPPASPLHSSTWPHLIVSGLLLPRC